MTVKKFWGKMNQKFELEFSHISSENLALEREYSFGVIEWKMAGQSESN